MEDARNVDCSAGGVFRGVADIADIFVSCAASSLAAATAKPGRWPRTKPCSSVPCPSSHRQATVPAAISNVRWSMNGDRDAHASTIRYDVAIVRQRTVRVVIQPLRLPCHDCIPL